MKTTRRHFLTCLLAVMLVCFAANPAAKAAEPLTPLMEILRTIIPSGEGWFLEGPLGAASGTPEEAAIYFQQPRIVLPDVDAVQPALGRLFAASDRLPLRKVKRYDEKPGAKGLPGLRLIWCETEDEDAVGFAVVTPEQNRFLIWARDSYYRAFVIDSIEPKVRDWYARSLSEYLASVAFGVPGSSPPLAVERQLPPWLDAYPPAPARVIADDGRLAEFLTLNSEIKIFDWNGMLACVPSQSTIERFISTAPDTIYRNNELFLIQRQYDECYAMGGRKTLVHELSRSVFDALTPGMHQFAVDRMGRIRVSKADSASSSGGVFTQTHALLFPGEPVLAAGWFDVGQHDGQNHLRSINAHSRTYYYSPYQSAIRSNITDWSNSNLLSLGHVFAGFEKLGIPYEGILIRKF